MEAEAQGTMACPICGVDRPHWHSDEQTAAYREDQIHQGDGWVSAAHRQPAVPGWYLCADIKIDRKQFGEKKDFWAPNDRWSQLSWFLWVREAGTHGAWENEIPEVLFYDPRAGGWFLRNFLGNAVPSGAESRHAVSAEPKYWRDLPLRRKIKD